MTIKAKLRRKPISKGRESLYLDFYPEVEIDGKKTRRQFLNLYLFHAPKNPIDKQHNKDTLTQAEKIRQRRENELNKPEIYSGHEREQLRQKELGQQSFYDFFQKQANKRTGTSYTSWASVLMHLKSFHDGDDLKFADITETFCNDFREFLLKAKLTHSGRSTLAHNTAGVYFSKFKTAVKQAYKNGYIHFDLNSRIPVIKAEETRRDYLTLDEVNALIQTECRKPVLKQAAIFSVYTGLRFSDIEKLTWGEIEEMSPGNFVINFKQKKTKGIETLPISKEALMFLGERKADNEKVFPSLLYSAYYNQILAKWVGLAGIKKDISFHAFRHTYATLQLTLGTDIYTVSKLLGHRDLKTTQIYAKIIDETKRAAANKIQLNINNWK